jgi:hypothetical protein
LARFPENGKHRAKRVILEIYDAMQESVRTGQPYQTRHPPTRAAAIRRGSEAAKKRVKKTKKLQ